MMFTEGTLTVEEFVTWYYNRKVMGAYAFWIFIILSLIYRLTPIHEKVEDWYKRNLPKRQWKEWLKKYHAKNTTTVYTLKK